MFEDDDEGRCVAFSSTFLTVINLLTCVAGLAVAGAGTYFYINAIGLFSDSGLIIGILTGVAIFMFSFVGMYGAMKKEKIPLIVYGVVVGLAMIAEVALVVILIGYLNELDSLEAGEEHNSKEVEGSTQIFFNDFILSTFNLCCRDKGYCPGEFPGDELYCPEIVDCDNSNATDTCFIDGKKSIQSAFCDLLKQGGVVGKFESDSDTQCGGSDPATYIALVVEFLNSNISVLYYIAGFTLFIEFLAVIFVAVLVYKTESSQVKAERARSYVPSHHFADPSNTVVSYERPESLARSSVGGASLNNAGGGPASKNTNRMSVRDSVRMSARHSAINGQQTRVHASSINSVTDSETGLQVAQPVDD